MILSLYAHKDVDLKRLRKLILESKLAPCVPGDEDSCCDLKECPICFLYYPSLNLSRCCVKGICTECFLRLKNPNSTRPTQCPFCKTSNYAVEHRGVKTKEEKGLEQIVGFDWLKSLPNRDAEFDLDLEDIMVMEPIWLSIQEKRRQKNPLCGDAAEAGTSYASSESAEDAAEDWSSYASSESAEDAAEAGTSYASSESAEDAAGISFV